MVDPTVMRRVLIGLTLLSTLASAQRQEAIDRLTLVAPAAPGGGWDQTARAMQRALEDEGLVRTVEVENVPGAAGTVGLAQFINAAPSDQPALLVTGLVMVGAVVFNDSPVSLSQTTPIARLTGEDEVIAVPAASPIRDMRELIARFRSRPAAVSWGGGSAGGTDHILAGLIAAAAGVDPRLVNYIAFSGGGEAATAALGGQVTVAISGYAEFAPHIQSGQLRALAISAPTPQTGVDAPPLSQAGIDVTLANWRGLVARPHISDDMRRQLTDTISRMSRSVSWQRTLEQRGWSDQFLVGAEFERFLDDERLRVTRISRALKPSGPPLAAPAHVFPAVVFVGSFVVAVALLLDGRRSARRNPIGRETIPIHRGALLLIVIGLGLYASLLTTGGFVVASTALFWMVAVAFDRTRWLRDLAVAAVFSTLLYVLFANGLGLSLPAGSLAAWIR
jgi:putative tricarboxylic transport membrane protein